jgi:hypothetical protein
MRGALRYLAGVVAGLVLGLGSAMWLTGLWPEGRSLAFGNVDVGGWRSDFAIGSRAADPYVRARVARHGLLALAKSEAVYFTRATDDDGALLREDCTYRLSGGAMPAGWWSVTLYDARSMLPANTDGALSLDASRAGKAAWEAIIASERPAGSGHWISSSEAGIFDLTLRLYLPEAALLADPNATLQAPRIERVSCAEGAA